MADEPQSLRSLYATAENARQSLETSYDTQSPNYQTTLTKALQLYAQCLTLAAQIALFSPNESLEDIASADLVYLLLHNRLGDLSLKLPATNSQTRKANILRASDEYSEFLKLLDSYDILPAEDAALYERYREAPTTFSTSASTDAAARRESKILRFRHERELKRKLEYLVQNPTALQNDDAAYRELQLTNVSYCAHQTFQALEGIAQELHILSLAPPETPERRRVLEGEAQDNQDARERGGRNADGYNSRLDMRQHLSAGMRGPLLDKKGKPLQPFTLLDNRSRMQNGVFRPDHSLPTMTIDEYLEEERKRGGMIDGGGPQSGIAPEVDEDDMERADRETMKARDWDEFVESNPKGSGNTLNRG